MSERNEQDALDGILLVRLGGEVHQVRTLFVEESDTWLGKVAAEVAAADLPEVGHMEERPAAEAFAHFLTEAAESAVRLIADYDIDGVLGGEAAIRGRAKKRDLRVAIERMVEAEDPFGEDAVRSVAAAFGAPSRSLWMMVSQIVGVAASLQGLSTDGDSSDTASDGETSDEAGPANSSSSDGPIPITKKPKSRKSA